MKFEVLKTDGNARAGVLVTAHSVIQTPVFMPVGTVGAVKSVDATDMSEILDAKIILANTYHMYLRPDFLILAARFSPIAAAFRRLACARTLKTTRAA